MSETERYVCYYRMPAIGDTHNGDALVRQRRDAAAFLDQNGRKLVGEFTEVMMPAREGETSPAFDLAIACCLDLGARLVCALDEADLELSAREKAARAGVEIHYAGITGPAPEGFGIPRGDEAVPHLRFRRDRRIVRPGNGVLAGNRKKADKFAAAILPIIEQIRSDGATTLTEIAEALNARNIRTARGRRWYPTTVKNILERLE